MFRFLIFGIQKIAMPVNKGKPKKRGRGRPATGRDPVVAVRLPASTIAGVDQWAEREEIGSRSEAIRRLIERGLADNQA